MPTAQFGQTINVGGIAIAAQATRTATGEISHEVTLPAGKSGTLSTRTDDNTGVATLAEGHGITDADTVDVFWDDGVRYGMDVTTVDGNDVSVDGGSGDNLPTQDTAVIVTPRVEINTDFDGDDVEMIAVGCDQRCNVDFLNDTPASLDAEEIAAGEAWSWMSSSGVTNPLTGDPVDTIQATNGSITAATLKIGVLYASS